MDYDDAAVFGDVEEYAPQEGSTRLSAIVSEEEAVEPRVEVHVEEPEETPQPLAVRNPDKFKNAKAKIEQILRERSSQVKSGWAEGYGFRRELPQWVDSAALSRAAREPVNWAIENLWTKQAKVLMAAEQKAGKSFLVCSVAFSYATESPLWENQRFRVMDPGPVGIIAGEDDQGEIGRRLDRMFRARGMLLSNYPVHFLNAHNMRMNRERDQEYIRKSVQDLGLRMLVYDPLARLMDGDENSKECVAAVLNPASQLAKDMDVSVMVVHHLGKQNQDAPRAAIARVRGSSDIASWFSCGLFLSGTMAARRLMVEVCQRTSGRIPNEFPLVVREDDDNQVHGLGAMRLIADLNEDQDVRAGRNERTIEDAAGEILDLVNRKGMEGVTLSEVQVHLGYGRMLINAAVKRLIRHDRSVLFDDAPDLPEKRVLIPNPVTSTPVIGGGGEPAAEEREEDRQLGLSGCL